jgi:hypothetical protein
LLSECTCQTKAKKHLASSKQLVHNSCFACQEINTKVEEILIDVTKQQKHFLSKENCSLSVYYIINLSNEEKIAIMSTRREEKQEMM